MTDRNNFYIEMVISSAFWVAICYRLAACLPEWEVHVDRNLLAIVPAF